MKKLSGTSYNAMPGKFFKLAHTCLHAQAVELVVTKIFQDFEKC